MYPKILDITIPYIHFHLPIYSYGFMLALGFLAALWMASYRARKESVDQTFLMDLGFVVLLAGIAGARIAYVAELHHEFSWQLFNVTDGGWSALGALLGAGSGATLAYYLPVSDEKRGTTARIIVTALAGSILMARLVHVFFHGDEYEGALDVIKIYRGGLSFWGGLILAGGVGIWYIRKREQALPVIMDLAAPSVSLGLAFGRIGCFLNGCCFGGITSSWVGVRFPGNGSGGTPVWSHHHAAGHINFADPYSLPVHPTQLYHAAAALLITGILLMAHRRRKAPGQVLLLLGMLYPLFRFPVAFLRDDMTRPLFGLTSYQLLAIPVFLVCLVWYIKFGRSVNPSTS